MPSSEGDHIYFYAVKTWRNLESLWIGVNDVIWFKWLRLFSDYTNWTCSLRSVSLHLILENWGRKKKSHGRWALWDINHSKSSLPSSPNCQGYKTAAVCKMAMLLSLQILRFQCKLNKWLHRFLQHVWF